MRLLNSRQNSGSTSSATSRRQPSMSSARVQCSATPMVFADLRVVGAQLGHGPDVHGGSRVGPWGYAHGQVVDVEPAHVWRVGPAGDHVLNAKNMWPLWLNTASAPRGCPARGTPARASWPPPRRRSVGRCACSQWCRICGYLETEYRRQVQAVHAQLGDVVETVDDACAAGEGVGAGRIIAAAGAWRIVGRVAVGEALHEYLVDDGVVCPVWRAIEAVGAPPEGG